MADKKLFGTDGIRGAANVYPMTPEVVTRIGQALGHILKKQPIRKGTKRTVFNRQGHSAFGLYD